MRTLISLKQQVTCSGMSHQHNQSATRVATATSQFLGADVKGIRLCEVSLTYSISQAVADTLQGLGFAGKKKERYPFAKLTRMLTFKTNLFTNKLQLIP